MMNTLHIDLNEKHQTLRVRQRFYTYLGIAFCLFGVFTLFLDEVSLGQVISSSLNFIMGLMLLILANPSVFKWTRSYIDVSDTGIQYRFWGIQSKTMIHWESVESMTMDFNEVTIHLGNDRIKLLNLDFISDSNNQRIKQSLVDWGNEKGIEILEKEA